ncbi:LicD family protein [Methanobrevibacter millerae]|uniref:Phosphorylcholine metabolism protein LicD n=1 Tax=Methanobrevibacter millerae TaxID=230361 RepID=A0A1G5WW77_9EURY|nr:LicD family protein [Methanobrevibacter millerae]SDA61767.1 Phosphorylcholine metabolism protein LicD [Methanobrevibacter millerae]
MDKDIKFLKEEIKKLNNQINNLNKVQKKNENTLDSHYTLLNTLYLNFNLKPKGVLKGTQDLCLSLLDFISNVCMKYDLEWWLDYGNLLGAVRDKDYVPWDDDIDIGMTRKDCLKFLEVIDDEIKYYHLDDILFVVPQKIIKENSIIAFTQISIKKDGGLYAGLDVFPIDFIRSYPENVEKEFFNAKCEYHINLLNGMDKKDVINKYYDDYNLSYEYQDFFIPCIETYWGNTRKFTVFDSEKLFPLKKIEFHGKIYPCPNNPHYITSKNYGKDYKNIPRNVKLHRRVSDLKQKKNVNMNFKNFLKRFEEVNDEFSSKILHSKNVVYFSKNQDRYLNINQEIPKNHVIKFNFNRQSSKNCRGYIQIGTDWNNSIFIGQIGAGNTFGIWLRKNGITDYHNTPIPSNSFLGIEYTYKDNTHTLKVDDEIVLQITSKNYEYNNLLNIIVDNNSKITDLVIY